MRAVHSWLDLGLPEPELGMAFIFQPWVSECLLATLTQPLPVPCCGTECTLVPAGDSGSSSVVRQLSSEVP